MECRPGQGLERIENREHIVSHGGIWRQRNIENHTETEKNLTWKDPQRGRQKHKRDWHKDREKYRKVFTQRPSKENRQRFT